MDHYFHDGTRRLRILGGIIQNKNIPEINEPGSWTQKLRISERFQNNISMVKS